MDNKHKPYKNNVRAFEKKVGELLTKKPDQANKESSGWEGQVFDWAQQNPNETINAQDFIEGLELQGVLFLKDLEQLAKENPDRINFSRSRSGRPAQLTSRFPPLGVVAARRARHKRLTEDLEQTTQEFQQAHQHSRNRALAIVQARDTLLIDQVRNAIKDVFAGGIQVKPYKPMKKKPTARVLNTIWSDLHFGSLLDPREVPLRYGPVEEARRIAAVAVQVAEFKRQYRDETEVAVNLAGDIFQGQLHDARDGAPLAEQAAASIHLLAQAISFLSSQFKRVTVRCTSGNHGRNTARHPQRATLQKWDSIETIVYVALKAALSRVPNVTVEIGYRPYYLYKNFGKTTFVTHGDTVLKPGYPGSTINVADVRKQINEFNAARSEEERATLFAVGHVHVGSITRLPNGSIFMSNGCLIPPDGYAQSIGVHDTACGQWIWESVEDHLVGDTRFAVVDEYTDKDSRLDKIVTPFTGF